MRTDPFRLLPRPHRRILPVTLLLFCALPLAGCHSAPPMRAVGIDRYSPEKDVLVFQVEIAELGTPRGYRDWAQAQLDAAGGEPENERYPGIPVYEVTYRVRVSREIVAEVTFRRGEGGRGPLVHDQTVVRAVPEWLLDDDGS